MAKIDINLNNCIIPMYKPVLKDILDHGHTHYVFPGGRGSTKSSFAGGIAIPLLIMAYPKCHAVCFRKVGNTVQKSIFSQVVWGINQLGVESLFKIPKTFSTPITYIPTGQQIIFMGLDDPQKVKSIKLPFGYIGITWFEELDQYSGENELRNVTQSTMRGGDKFWDFRTFNPPISKNNWANEYVENCELYRPHDTLVVRNTYLDVPVEWLGQQFIDEAEELKKINERAYIHEYMGQAIGTGGDVFQNVEDLDMYSPRTIKDVNGNDITAPALVDTFDTIYNGMDVGFAMDPTRLVRCYFNVGSLDLYIFCEYTTSHNRSEDIYRQIYEEKKLLTNNDMLIADPGGGGLFVIADFRAFGAFIRAADKGPGSVDYGIKWLQGLRHIYIDKKHCPETWKEFVEYEYEQDKDGNFISAYPDENNHSIDSVRYALQKYCNRKGN